MTNYPFRRLAVDHMVDGVSRVWWELDPLFSDPAPHSFQLQAGNTGLPTATDWTDVGDPADSWYAEDEGKRLYGKLLYTHYRVSLTTAAGVYVSEPAPVWGILNEADWLRAREIVRRERLRLRLIAGQDGLLLKRKRFGVRCDRCLDTITNEVTDSRCPHCHGTGFKSGYHAPAPFQCWDLSPRSFVEKRNEATPPGHQNQIVVTARVVSAPALALEDVWVNGHSDERWFVQDVKHLAELRGVPLVTEVTLRLAPFTDAVYRIGVGGEPNDNVLSELPTVGTGSVRVSHDYGGQDALAYQLADGCGIGGATIRAFTQADYTAGLRDAAHAVATSSTAANGRWDFAMQLDPGSYVLVFEKLGECGPNATAITVTTPVPRSMRAITPPPPRPSVHIADLPSTQLAAVPISPLPLLPAPSPQPNLQTVPSGSRLAKLFEQQFGPV